MTKKQLERMNGAMSTYNLNAPMTWDQFKYMPNDLQREYLEKLRNRFNVTNGELGKMFGVTGDAIRKYCHSHKLGDLVDKHWMTNEEKERWRVFVEETVSSMPTLPIERKGEKAVDVNKITTDIVTMAKEPAPKMTEAEAKAKTLTNSFTLCMEGTIDVKKVVSMLDAMLALCPDGCLKIS